MTVKEIIKELQKQDPDAVVVIDRAGYNWEVTLLSKVEDEYYMNKARETLQGKVVLFE
jgi:2',3'-cyclic-nucleotide 2'-phosphodiesterase (5'-nucleotidase family)